MPGISAPSSDKPIKLLYLGDSSTGKTGSLASLAAAGYNLRIIDLDNGCDIFWDLFNGPKAKYPAEALDRIRYVTCTDPMENIGGKLWPKASKAWARMIGLMDNWIDGEDRFGNLSKWTGRDILVLDSLTRTGTIGMTFHLGMNGLLGKTRTSNEWRRDINVVQSQLIEPVLQLLFDATTRCNVIVISHITYTVEAEAKAGGIEKEEDKEKLSRKGFPSSIGQALGPRIPQYFNHVLQAKTVGSGLATRHKIYTKTQGHVDLKTSAPNSVPAELPLDTGLADYFRLLRGPLPTEGPKSQTLSPPTSLEVAKSATAPLPMIYPVKS